MQRISRDRAHAPIHPSHKAQRPKTSLIASIAAAAISLLGAGPAQAQVSATFPAAADATLYQDITGGIANTRGDFVHAGPNNGAQARRAVIRFDLSSIPPGSTITAASLRMVVTQMRAGGGTATITAHRLTSSWSEGPPRSPSDVLPPAGEGSGAPPRPADVTWLHRLSPSTFWTSAGGDFIATASATVTAAGLGAQTWTGTSIIADVQNWVNDSNTNNGWLLRGNEALTGSARQMASRSNPTTANRPSLSVTFLPPPGAGACCFTSGQCLVTLPTTCTSMGGNFNGVGVLCSPNNPCPQPTGVCCLPSGACQITTPPNCATLSGDYRGDNLTCAQVSCPIPLEPFVDALPIPPVAVPTTGVSGGAAHYDITMREFTAKVHRDLPPTRQWGYNGISPGPTIIARKGQPVTVNWINDLRDSNNVLRTTHLLPVDTCLHGPDVTGAVPVTVVHLHGAKVAPASDGDPDAAFPPGSQAPLYTYPNDQLATTLWYHDHALGLTRLNVHMGLAAFYLIRDSVEDALNIPRGEYEIPLLLMDRSFNGDGSIRYNPAFSDTFFGDTILVNGKAWPFLNVKRTKYRFRIVNSSGTRTFTLSLSNGAQFQQIGSDGGLLASPATLSSVTIQPSERADIVIDFATLTPGESVILRNSAPAPFPGTQGVGVVPNVMKFVVQPEFGPGVFLPATLASVPRIPESQATVSREFRLQQVFEPTCGYNMWTINGLSWDDITEFPRIGTTEIWSFANLSTVTHPLHVHLVQMQILDRQDFVVQEGNIVPVGTRNPPPANEAGWKDTVQVYPQQITRAIMKFDGFSGLFPYHCHILEHEDHEMMRKFEVLCDPPSVQTPPQQLTVNENATAQFSVAASGDVLAYQWRRNNVNINNGPQTGGSVVSGATTNTLTITTPDPRDSAPYTCVITNPCGLSATAPVNLIVTPACPGDLNFNNAVNTADLTIFLANFGRSVQPGTNGDLNADGAVNTIDLTIFLTNFGRPCP